MTDLADRASSEDLERIENACNVVVDVDNNGGCTYVYGYTNDGERIGFTFDSMNPVTADVLAVAQAVDTLRTIANKRPRVGRLRLVMS